MRRLLIFTFALATFAGADEKDNQSAVSFTEIDNRLRVELDGELFTEYRFNDPDRFFPAFYPIINPGGTKMTRRFPFEESKNEDTDHPHHQSLWFAHSDINGYTFWATREYKGRKPGHTVHQEFTEIVNSEKGGHFVAKNHYVAPGDEIIMTDTRGSNFQERRKRGFSTSRSPFMLLTVTFLSMTKKMPEMAIRVASDLQVERRTKVKNEYLKGNGALINSEGDSGRETWGRKARWVHSHGKVEGNPVGIVIMDHPSNPRYPTYWHSRTYGLITANIYGKHFFENLDDPEAGAMKLRKGEEATFRWRFIFHKGGADSIDVERFFKEFSGQ